MSNRASRNRSTQKKSTGNGKIFVQIIICIAIICGFMIFKDINLPGGRTPRDYAEQILTTTVNLPEVIAKIKDEDVLPAGANIFRP